MEEKRFPISDERVWIKYSELRALAQAAAKFELIYNAVERGVPTMYIKDMLGAAAKEARDDA